MMSGVEFLNLIQTGKHHFHRFLFSKFANNLQIVLADRSDEIEAIKREYEKEIKSWKELAELKVWNFIGFYILYQTAPTFTYT